MVKINLDMKGELECGWVVGNKRPRRPTSSFQGSKRLLWSYIISQRATKKIFSDISTFSFSVCSSASWQFCVALASTAAKNQVQGQFLRGLWDRCPQNTIVKKSLYSISFANFPNLLFSRLGLLPVLVLLLYNPDYHRFRGLCGSSTGAQLDKKSWLCCHQVCSWWGQRVQLILKININDNTLCWPFFRKLLLSAVGPLCCGLLCQSSCS